MKKALLYSLLLAFSIQFAFGQTVQKVLIEEHTGAWCGYCPDGALILEDVLANHPNAIAVSVHNSDGMSNSTGSLIQGYYSPSYPQATINRSNAPISRNSWEAATAAALQETPIVAISIDSAGYNSGTHILKVKVKATFLADYSGNLRMNVFVTEDGVSGTGSGFDQVNYYNSVTTSPLYNLGNPIVGWVHNHVFRVGMGGAWGTANIIPATVTSGEVFFHTFTSTLNAAWNTNNMNIIGMVSIYGTGMTGRKILNAEQVPFSVTTAISPSLSDGTLKLDVHPNPMNDRSTITFNVTESGNVGLELYSLTGQKVRVLADEVTNSGLHTVNWDGNDASGLPLANGVYVMRLRMESGANISKRIMISR